MKNKPFSVFFKEASKKNKDIDYLTLIENYSASRSLAGFFDKSVVDLVPHRSLIKLVNAINADVRSKVFDYTSASENLPFSHTLTLEQRNSKTHKLFLDIIKKNFGSAAKDLLEQRDNLTIFNLKDIHFLHQVIFDSYGEEFVNRILNNDFQDHSLCLIRDILTDPEKKKNFDFLHNFYKTNIGFSQMHFEQMIRTYYFHQDLLHDIRRSKIKLSNEQILTLKEIFSDIDNMHVVHTLKSLNEFYEMKNNKYIYEKNKANKHYDKKEYLEANRQLATALFANFYGMKYEYFKDNRFSLSDTNPAHLKNYFNLENMDLIKKKLNEEEIEMLEDLKRIVELTECSTEESFLEMQAFCKKYEERGNKTSRIGMGIKEKLMDVYVTAMLDSISKIDEIKKRVSKGEKGVFLEKHPKTLTGKEFDNPVYVFDGADFAFLSTTSTIEGGISGNAIVGDFAESWFKYENGTTHISCSYANQDLLANFEFHPTEQFKDNRVTYLFEDVEIFTMGPTDIYTPGESRYSDVRSSTSTKFTDPKSLMEEAKKMFVYQGSLTEAGINRYSYDGKIKFGGKIIPTGILCADGVSDVQLEAAKSFERFCIKNGFRDNGWKMPIVVVKQATYEQKNNTKAQQLISKNAEYFVKPADKTKETENTTTPVPTKEEENEKSVAKL